MLMTTTTVGSAAFQSKLWGATSRGWADYQEPLMKPWYEAVLNRAGVGKDTRLLDVGCGAGLVVHLAAQRGAVVSGLDATPEFVAIARGRTPQADVHLGEMEALPFDEGAFDVVTGFNAFQFAATPVHALMEAHRVVQAEGRVVVGIFGREQDCDMAAPLAAFSRLMPPPPGAQGPFALSENGTLEGLVRKAGLVPLETADVDVPYDFAEASLALNCLLSNGPAVIAIRTSGIERVRRAVLDSIAPFKTATQGYHLDNKFRYLIARPGPGIAH
jgi:SAM-dependent methyltransferase